MHQHEDPHATFENEPAHNGGAAPEHRRCQYIKADGKGCRDWAVRGQGFCYRHGVFLRPESVRHIDVPLLEDEASIVLVLSETLRALACGTMPVNNGRLILDGCRLAHTIHMEKQAAARLRRRDQALSCKEQRTEEEEEAVIQECGALCPEPAAPSSEEPAAPSSELCPACGTVPSDPAALRTEPCEVCGGPASQAADLRPEPCEGTLSCDREQSGNTEWDNVQSMRTNRLAPLCGETLEECLVAQAAPQEKRIAEGALFVG